MTTPDDKKVSDSGDGSYRVLYNDCYGGFGFSDAFMEEYARRWPDSGVENSKTRYCEPCRDDDNAISLFDEMGSKWSSGKHGKLKTILVPPGCKYKYSEYDGKEDVFAVPDINKDDVVEDLLTIARSHCGLFTPQMSLGFRSPMTQPLLNSGLTLKEFDKKLYAEMEVYLEAHPHVDKP